MKAVVYKITNLKTGLYYIGSTKNLTDRIKTHFKQLSTGRHHNSGMQKDFEIYGESAFNYEVIHQGDFEGVLHLLRIETSFIRKGKKQDMYNIERNPLKRYQKECAKAKTKKNHTPPRPRKKKKARKFYTVRGIKLRA